VTLSRFARLRHAARGAALLQAWGFLRDTPRVLPYVRPYWKLGAASVGLSGLGVLVSLAAPWPLAILVDTVLGKKPVPSILQPLIGTWHRSSLLLLAVVGGLLVTAFQNGLNVVSEYVSTKLDQRMVLDLRSDLFRHAHRLSQEFHDRTFTGSLMYRINNQANAMGAIAVAVTPLGQAVESPPSPINPDVMQAVERIVGEMWPGVPVIPIMSGGYTDSRWLRNAGIPAYGVSGLFSEGANSGVHGRNEHVGVKQVYDSKEFLYRLVKALAGSAAK
jgi:acetylornithine deacetylase/succinyl-diaminopimelate desuccinylase-like protein